MKYYMKAITSNLPGQDWRDINNITLYGGSAGYQGLYNCTNTLILKQLQPNNKEQNKYNINEDGDKHQVSKILISIAELN